jgi:hypothetical protein
MEIASMRYIRLGFVLIGLGVVYFSSHDCFAQERPRHAGTQNRFVATFSWPVRAYFVETRKTLRDLRTDQLLRVEAVSLFGAASFENATLEDIYHGNPTGVVGYPARLFVGHRPHGVQLWLVSGAANVALLDVAHHFSRNETGHKDVDHFVKYRSLAGVVALCTWYAVAGTHNLRLATR